MQSLISNSTSTIHPSQFNLSTAASPHYAAELEGIHLQVKDITLPRTNQPFILEGAGGIMVPISREEKILDLIIHLNIPVILVVKNYLGAINHALLSLEILQLHQVKIMGLIYNGGDRSENQSIIEHFSKIPTLGIIPEIDSINPNAILTEAAKFADINPFH